MSRDQCLSYLTADLVNAERIFFRGLILPNTHTYDTLSFYMDRSEHTYTTVNVFRDKNLISILVVVSHAVHTKKQKHLITSDRNWYPGTK